MNERIFFPNKGQKLLAGVLNNGRPNSPVLIFVHGFGGNKEENGLFIDAENYFSQRGYNTFRFDMEGIGESQGTYRDTSLQRQVDDLEATLSHLLLLYPRNRVGVVGFSLGATASVLSSNPKIDAYALWSPALFLPQDMFPRYSTPELEEELQRNGFVLKPGSGLEIGPQIIEDFKTTNLEQRMSSLTKPVLLVHGTSDPRLDYRNTVKAATYFPDGHLEIIPGANHSYKENPPLRNALFEKTYAWLRTNL